MVTRTQPLSASSPSTFCGNLEGKLARQLICFGMKLKDEEFYYFQQTTFYLLCFFSLRKLRASNLLVPLLENLSLASDGIKSSGSFFLILSHKFVLSSLLCLACRWIFFFSFFFKFISFAVYLYGTLYTKLSRLYRIPVSPSDLKNESQFPVITHKFLICKRHCLACTK